MGAEVQEEWRRWAERSAWTTQERLQAADGRRTVETGSNNFETLYLAQMENDVLKKLQELERGNR